MPYINQSPDVSAAHAVIALIIGGVIGWLAVDAIFSMSSGKPRVNITNAGKTIEVIQGEEVIASFSRDMICGSNL